MKSYYFSREMQATGKYFNNCVLKILMFSILHIYVYNGNVFNIFICSLNLTSFSFLVFKFTKISGYTQQLS